MYFLIDAFFRTDKDVWVGFDDSMLTAAYTIRVSCTACLEIA